MLLVAFCGHHVVGLLPVFTDFIMHEFHTCLFQYVLLLYNGSVFVAVSAILTCYLTCLHQKLVAVNEVKCYNLNSFILV